MSMSLKEKSPSEPSLPTTLSYLHLVLDKARVTKAVYDHRYDGSGTDDDPYVVTWIENDAGNPMGMKTSTKWTMSVLLAVSTLAVAFNSSAFSGGLIQFIMQFDVSEEVITLGVSLFVLGFAVGPLIWAPLSEMFGRQIVFFISFGAFTAFNATSTASQNIQTLLILRFLAGAFGSSPLTNSGGVISDVFNAAERGLAFGAFALAPFLGPTIGPIVGGFVGETVGWKWIEGIMAIFSGILWISVSLLVPETYAPVLLKARAAKLSKLTGKVYKSEEEIATGNLSPFEIFSTTISRPLVLLFVEPIVLLLSIYMAIVYGTLYMLFGAYPIVFQEGRGWSEGIGGLAFVGIAVGMIAAWFYIIWDNAQYQRRAKASATGRLPPEERLKAGMVGAIALPVGMFWFAWTNYPSIHWFSSVAAGAPFGFGMVLVFLAITNYLIDAYSIYSASVLAANSVLRSLFGFAFPLFTRYMFNNLGIHWASSVPAFLSLVCVPLPFLFFRYGPMIRKWSKHAAVSEDFMAQYSKSTTSPEAAVSGDEERPASSSPPRTERLDSAKTEADDDLESDVSSSTEGSERLDRVPTIQESYEASPYDIDRVNTGGSGRLSLVLTRTRTGGRDMERANSRRSGRSGGRRL